MNHDTPSETLRLSRCHESIRQWVPEHGSPLDRQQVARQKYHWKNATTCNAVKHPFNFQKRVVWLPEFYRIRPEQQCQVCAEELRTIKATVHQTRQSEGLRIGA